MSQIPQLFHRYLSCVTDTPVVSQIPQLSQINQYADAQFDEYGLLGQLYVLIISPHSLS